MPSSSSATPTLCPLCTKKCERLDSLVKHISRKHNDISLYPLTTEAGLLYEPVAPGSHIVFCPTQKVGCCLKCFHPLHVSGVCKDRRTFFAAHVCKEKQVRDYGLGPGKGRKGSVPVPAGAAPATPTAAPEKPGVAETKTIRIIEKHYVPATAEEYEKYLRDDPKFGYLFKKPEPTPKENKDDWTDSEDEPEETFTETLIRILGDIPKYKAALKKVREDRAAAAIAEQQRSDALDMKMRELQRENAEVLEKLHNLARDTSDLNKEKQELITLVETHAPEPIVKAVRRRNNGYQNIHQPLPSHV